AIDAVIAADFSVMEYCRQLGIPLHISTQANVSNLESVRFFSSMADVVVLARELTLKQVGQITAEIKRKEIKGVSGNLMKVEIFVHGALCMAVSGKCYLSLHTQNASANRGACVQNCRRSYTVTDNEKPTITAPANISVNNDAGQCGATINIGTPTTGDNCGVASVSNNHPSTTYPVGTTTVTWTVTDMHGNSSTATQTVTVTDNELPVITSNGDQSVNNDAGKCGAIVTVSASAKDNCGVGIPSGVRSDGLALTDTYPVGTTTITWTVTDIHTNNAIPVTQTIIVTDHEKPVITVPADQVFCANADGSVNYSIPVSSATDNCGVSTVSYAVSGATTR
ncbi:MAG: hypothetical protein B7Y76_14955, partial [Sphingobacteriia bacterium 35-40-5]